MNTNSLAFLVVLASATLAGSGPLQAQNAEEVVVNRTILQTTQETDAPNAVVLSVHGTCEYSGDGVHFRALEKEQVFSMRSKSTPFHLSPGAVVRTGAKSRLDLFVRGVGTTIRLQPDTEVLIEQMSRINRGGVPELHTVLDLRRGRIFAAVRSLVEGSVFEIRNAAGRSVVEGAPADGLGRYIITADGTQVADKASRLPLKLIGDGGITVILPGQKFDAKEGRLLPVDTSETEQMLISFDELHALAESMEAEAGGAGVDR